MGNSEASALLSLIGSLFMLLWPYALTKSVSASTSLSAGQGEERPHVVKRSTPSCDSTFDDYCLNKGQCMFLVDIDEHHCRCDVGFYGPRCANLELVTQPMGDGQMIVTVFCVSLLIVGLAGALYFFCKWYKKNRGSQRRLDYLECLTHKPTASAEKANREFPQFSNRMYYNITVTLPDALHLPTPGGRFTGLGPLPILLSHVALDPFVKQADRHKEIKTLDETAL